AFTSVIVSGDSGSSTSGDVATLNVSPGETIVVTYTDTLGATVRVVKNTIGGNDRFNFATTTVLVGQSSPAIPKPFSITTAVGTGSSSTFTFSGLPAGGASLNFSEIVPAGWSFAQLQVSGDDDSVVINQTAMLNVEPGESIVVTYTDTKDATVQVVKNTIGGNDTFSFATSGVLVGQRSPLVPVPISIPTADSTATTTTFTFTAH